MESNPSTPDRAASAAARALRQLREDGLDDLGTIELGSTVVVGDPSLVVTPPGSGAWFGAGVRAGTWHLLGRPWWHDRDQLEELILVHASVLPTFYTAYDEATRAATLPLPRHRLVVLDGALRTDAGVLRSLVEVEELPWVLDRACVLAGIGDHDVQVIAARTTDTVLVAIGLSRPPAERASPEPFTKDRSEDDDV